MHQLLPQALEKIQMYTKMSDFYENHEKSYFLLDFLGISGFRGQLPGAFGRSIRVEIGRWWGVLARYLRWVKLLEDTSLRGGLWHADRPEGVGG